MRDSLSVAPLGLCLGYIIGATILALMSSCKHAQTDKPPPGYTCKLLPEADGGVTLTCVK